MSRPLLRMILLLALAFASVAGHRSYSRNASQAIQLVPLPLDAGDPRRREVGALYFLGGWEMRSDNSDFGGLSGLTALGNNRFLAISDAGMLVGFTLDGGRALKHSFITPLPGTKSADPDYRDQDSESLTRDPATGRIWVGYEVRHAIRRFNAALSRVDGIRRLAFARDWKANGGVEALVRLADGRFLTIAETHERADGGNSAYLFSGDPAEPGVGVIEFGLRAPAGYRPTDAALLPDGRLLILNRKIGLPLGFTAKLTLLDPAQIDAGKTVDPTLLATLAPPLLVDNMEGLAITMEGDRTVVWMLSDDNFTALQRTLLMKFVLRLPDKKPEADTAPGFETLGR